MASATCGQNVWDSINRRGQGYIFLRVLHGLRAKVSIKLAKTSILNPPILAGLLAETEKIVSGLK
jgi:hypothetical protein